MDSLCSFVFKLNMLLRNCSLLYKGLSPPLTPEVSIRITLATSNKKHLNSTTESQKNKINPHIWGIDIFTFCSDDNFTLLIYLCQKDKCKGCRGISAVEYMLSVSKALGSGGNCSEVKSDYCLGNEVERPGVLIPVPHNKVGNLQMPILPVPMHLMSSGLSSPQVYVSMQICTYITICAHRSQLLHSKSVGS